MKTTWRDIQIFAGDRVQHLARHVLGKNTLFDGSRATWGSSGINRRSFLTRFLMIADYVFDICVGGSGIDPGVVWDHLKKQLGQSGTPTCHAGEAEGGFGPRVE